jgi:type VI secretion system secreted protein Hcp
MAVDMFLKLDGIKGESQDKDHKQEIDILTWSWGGSQPVSGHMGGGGGSGKVNFNDLSVTKWIDSASTKLYTSLAKGAHIKEAILTVRKAGGDKPVDAMKWTMKECLISSVQMTANHSDVRLMEIISLNFATVACEYVPQKADGTADAKTTFSWDIKKNVEK